MSLTPQQTNKSTTIPPVAILVVYAFTVLLMANLNALVDFFLHPEIPYFDHEHVVVGVISGMVTGVLLILLNREIGSLRSTLAKVRSLESILPICSFCKKIREPDGDPKSRTSWHPIEQYISDRTSSEFTHGVCPDCMSKFFPADPARP